MSNPWEEICLDDYENHMSLDSVKQLQAMNSIMKEQFEAYMTAQREVNVLTDCETFIYSFRLAAKIMIDVLTDGQMREI